MKIKIASLVAAIGAQIFSLPSHAQLTQLDCLSSDKAVHLTLEFDVVTKTASFQLQQTGADTENGVVRGPIQYSNSGSVISLGANGTPRCPRDLRSRFCDRWEPPYEQFLSLTVQPEGIHFSYDSSLENKELDLQFAGSCTGLN